jgi:hypothetical protein
MAIIKLSKVTCLESSGGHIELKINTQTLLPSCQFLGELQPTPIPVQFIGTIAIELYDDSDGNGGLLSVGMTPGITTLIEPAGRQTIIYNNGNCSGFYILDYEVSLEDPTEILVA